MMGAVGVIRVDQYHDIREMYLKEGKSQRAIARELKISRNTVKRYCEGRNMPWERKPVEREAKVITKDVIEFMTLSMQANGLPP